MAAPTARPFDASMHISRAVWQIRKSLDRSSAAARLATGDARSPMPESSAGPVSGAAKLSQIEGG